MSRVIAALIRFYQAWISPLLGPRCRFYPTCSRYALTAVERHGALKGSWLATRRLGRCHPWSDGGVDLVPAPDDYRWWGRCPGHDPDATPVPAPSPLHDEPSAEGA